MSEILLRADEARDQARNVRRVADEAQQQIKGLQSRLSELQNSFRGRTQQAFDDKYNEWHQGADQMLEGLDGLGEFLESAADIIEQADADIAGQLG